MDWIVPMEPVLTDRLVDGEDWIHQIKWDGIRGMTYIERGVFKVFTKKGRERTEFYPELSIITDLVNTDSTVLDGEIIVLDEKGSPSFHRMLTRERVRNIDRVRYYSKLYPVSYIVFDILRLNGRDMTSLSLLERKDQLIKILKPSKNIGITDDYTDGESLFDFMKEKAWEGIVSKRKSSRYLPGKNHNSWYKLKNIKKLLAVVCGVTWKGNNPNSLILGIFREDELIYIGKASSGLTQENLYEIKRNVKELEQRDCPFKGIPFIKGDRITWFRPLLLCWVKFLEWTMDGVLRHPVITGFYTGSIYEAKGEEKLADD